MCGICGILDYNHRIKEEALHRMCERMKHRGPDGEGTYFSIKEISVGLGHRRLKVIDLSEAAAQPMSNEDGTVWITFNGEIYNYKELRINLEQKGHKFKSLSDTETIIHLYEDYGVDCVRYLRGMFAFAIWDENKRQLFLARDRFGKKPLLYYYKNGVFCFASEFSGILSGGIIPKNINYEAINYYLSLGYIPAPSTIYEDVHKLLPAHTLILKDKVLTLTRYWQLDYIKKISISEEEAQHEIFRLLEDAVKVRLYSDVPLGAFLSGGIDSGAVVSLMCKLSSNKVNTFSIGFNEADYNELSFAKRIAERYNTRHNEFIVKPEAVKILPALVEHYGEPYADSSCIPTYYISKITRQYVTVALNGDGGDELFAGYDRYSAVLLAQKYRKSPIFVRELLRLLLGHLPEKNEPKNIVTRLKRFLNGATLNTVKGYLYWVSIMKNNEKQKLYSSDFRNRVNLDAGTALERAWDDLSNLGIIDRLLYVDTMTYLPDDLLVKVDIASMANSLEARSPLLDQQLAEFVASLPQEYKIKSGIKKYIFKKAIKDLLPKKNIYRRKMGFGVPVSKWLRNEMKDYLQATILSSKCLNRGYFKPAAIKELLDAHTKGKVDYGAQLWALLMLELWHQEFID